MANTSIGGLVSGLDTATIISQLMQLEAQPQTRLKTRVTTEQSVITALQALNTKLATLATKAAELAKTSTWATATATSSSQHVTATAGSGAGPASLTFTVSQTAARSQAVFADAATRGTAVAPPNTDLTVTFAGGRSVTVNTGDGSLESIAASVNAAAIDGEDAGLDAVLVRAGGTADAPSYRLMVTTATTGDATRFTISDPNFLGGATVVDGRDAVIAVAGVESRSATNSFDDLMPGVDVTFGAEATGAVTVTVAPDASALGDKVKALIDAVNTVLADIDTLTNYNASTKKAGLLGGDTTLRSVRDQLLTSVVGGVGGTSPVGVGIQLDRNGKLSFDSDKFKASYAADAAKLGELFVDNDGTGVDQGLAANIEVLTKRFSNATDGVVTRLVTGREKTVDGLNDAIASWDTRLAVRRSALERQYGALEVALGKLQSQSSWLAGQISSLPTTSG